MNSEPRPGNGTSHAVPDAAPAPESGFDIGGEWVLGGEAAVPTRDYGPPISSKLPTPQTVAGEIRELERRFRARLTPLVPLRGPRRLPLRFLWSRYRQLAMRERSTEVDDYGYDPGIAARAKPILDLLSRRYFRVELHGQHHLPAGGAAILVANHSGALPFDTVLLMHAIAHQHPAGRRLRPLLEDFLYHAPFLGVYLRSLGAVRACPENAMRLLAAHKLVAVFPEGEKGPSKLFKDRYKLQRFGRGGFVKLALRSGAPIIPVAIIGAEETTPVLGKLSRLTKTLGIPNLPITPTFPWLGPLGLVPLPSKWSIHFGAPIYPSQSHPTEAADDRLLIGQLAADVRCKVQDLVDAALAERKSIVFG